MLQNTALYYFSPTGGTKNVGVAFCQGISEQVREVNLGQRTEKIENTDEVLSVVTMPVFGGRVPAIAVEKLKALDGRGKKAVTLVVYGTRAYEDALLELNNAVSAQGFQIVASGAFVAQHSMASEVGKGRPDHQDVKEINDFAEKVLDKLLNKVEGQVTVPGNFPYKESMSMPVTPLSLPSCKQCGKCEVKCPVGAVSKENGIMVTNSETCILCMACVAGCKEQARILPPPLQEKMEQMLGALKAVRRENECFV